MKSAAPKNAAASVSKQLAGFIAKFDPEVAKLIRACRDEMRQLLPTAIELVYDNYNFFVIGYGPTERASDAILSIAVTGRFKTSQSGSLQNRPLRGADFITGPRWVSRFLFLGQQPAEPRPVEPGSSRSSPPARGCL